MEVFNRMNKGVKIGVMVFVIGVLFLLALGLRGGWQVVDVGDQAVNFQLEDVDGKLHSLSDYQGKVVVLNFFTSWCQPCLNEAPELEAFQQNYQEQATLLIIDRGETKGQVAKYIQSQNSKLTYLLDYRNDVSDVYKVKGQPETIIIDKDGYIRERIVGEVTMDVLIEKVNKYQ